MGIGINYKFSNLMNLSQPKQSNLPLLEQLSNSERELIGILEAKYRFSFQQLKILSEWLVDIRMWKEPSLEKELLSRIDYLTQKNFPWTDKQKGEWIFKEIKKHYESIRAQPKKFEIPNEKEKFAKYHYSEKKLTGNIYRLCPAASERAVCCNLKVLNIVENCAMECSYCVLQNHYDEAEIKVPTNLKEKLSSIHIDPNIPQHICTGEYSDSLMWGNKNNILKDLCDFAESHPNILLEFKTKSSNISYFLDNPFPANVCCGWSVNPEKIVLNEEKKTASLEARLLAARKVADKGMKLAFHFHPIIYFENWEEEYSLLIEKIQSMFSKEEVLYTSLGTVTFLKGMDHQLRKNRQHTKILQMPFEETPDGKLTYPFEIRKKLYQHVLEALKPWKDDVFAYLCMEHKPMWDSIMDYTYKNMPEFNQAFCDSTFKKLGT